MLKWPVWESESDNTKCNTPAPHSHLRPCNTNESHDTGERKWLIGVRVNYLGVYSVLWPAVWTLLAVCWVILRGQKIYTVIQAAHSLLYIVAKCQFFSVVTWKYIIKYLHKCEGCTHFCEILYIKKSILTLPSFRMAVGRCFLFHFNFLFYFYNPK